MVPSYKPLYSRFLKANPERLHFAAHSHHLWPDVTRDAQIQYWDDCARLADYKWEHIFGQVIPQAQNNIAQILGLSQPSQICFAPNTHEFIARLLSCFDNSRPLRILTSDSEFHSFERQSARYQELANVSVTRIALEPFGSFQSRFIEAAKATDFDLVFLSQVFFSCGHVISDLDGLVNALPSSSTVVVDGYHAFCAVPTDLSKLERRIFYLGGGYKYAQAGEGACFMYIPPDCKLRPLNTGWFASFGTLQSTSKNSSQTAFSNDAFRFFGATFDASGLYRFNAVMRLFKDQGLSVTKIHDYVLDLKKYLLNQLSSAAKLEFGLADLINNDAENAAHFLSFRFPAAKQTCDNLAKLQIVTDLRGDCLRFGFGLYQDRTDIDQFFKRYCSTI